jgi:NhaA family Na+:H+ antiporter
VNSPDDDHYDSTARTEPIERVFAPFQRFLKAQTTSGILLLGVTVLALVWANSPWAESYDALWHLKLKFELGGFVLSETLHWWINDALMAAFFFLVGLEIKREFLVGELSTRNKAAFPIAAAMGGMVVPAMLFSIFNFGGAGQRGWGVPMATDIAFAIGVLTLLGDRVPLSAKVFLTALAIVDDIGASLVIALFYTDDLSWWSLAVAGIFFLTMLIANRSGVRSPLAFFMLGLGVWCGFLKSGVHPTLSGIIGALAIPARVRINAAEFLWQSRRSIDIFKQAGLTGDSVLTNPQQRGALHSLETAVRHAETPLQRLEHRMHPWVLFVVMPLFALANAGVSLRGDLASAFTDPVALGIIAGLVIGKPLGVVSFSWLAVRTGIATLPTGVSWRWIAGMAFLAGIGFTMSLFISGLAFVDQERLRVAKLAILAASVVAGAVGWMLLHRLTTRRTSNTER